MYKVSALTCTIRNIGGVTRSPEYRVKENTPYVSIQKKEISPKKCRIKRINSQSVFCPVNKPAPFAISSCVA